MNCPFCRGELTTYGVVVLCVNIAMLVVLPAWTFALFEHSSNLEDIKIQLLECSGAYTCEKNDFGLLECRPTGNNFFMYNFTGKESNDSIIRPPPDFFQESGKFELEND